MPDAMPKGYWIARVDVEDAEQYRAYVAANADPFARFGARFLVRGGRYENPEGASRARNVVIEFPSYQAALDCWKSPAYQAAIELRRPVSVIDLVIAEGYDGVQATAADQRPSIDAARVSLREIDAANVIAVTRLAVAASQKGFVAPNAVSLAQALFAPEAWYRAICHGDDPVGFVMLEDESLRSPPPPRPEVGVWRFMIDERFQGHGIGEAAMRLVIEHVRRKGLFDRLELSFVPGPGCPEPFYLGLGFRHTGRVDGAEVVLELPLAEDAG